jgi:hypothetical protein
MSNFEDQISKHYNWTLEYYNKVGVEYERFMILKSNINQVLPSDDIEKLWIYHLYTTDNYSNYCLSKFNKIINYTIIKKTDTDYKNNFYQTINYYKNTFGEFKFPEIWNCTISITVLEIESIIKQINPQMQILTIPSQTFIQQPLIQQPVNNENSIWKLSKNNQVNIPSYIINKPSQGEIKVYIYFKSFVPYGSDAFDKKIIPYVSNNQNETVDLFKDVISKSTNINKNIIFMKIHPDISLTMMDKITYVLNDYVKPNILIKDLLNKGYNFFIIEINN